MAVVVDVATACAAGKSGLAGACEVGGWAAGGAGCGGISPPIIGIGAPGMPPCAMNGGIPMAAMWCGAMWCGAMGCGAMPGGMPGGAKGGMPGMCPAAIMAGCMAPRCGCIRAAMLMGAAAAAFAAPAARAGFSCAAARAAACWACSTDCWALAACGAGCLAAGFSSSSPEPPLSCLCRSCSRMSSSGMPSMP